LQLKPTQRRSNEAESEKVRMARSHFEKSMKTTIETNETKRGRTDLLLSRRLGSGWFLIQTASLVRDQRNQRLLWAMRTQRVEPPHEAAFESRTLQHVTP